MNSLIHKFGAWLAKKFPFYALEGDTVIPRKSLGARFGLGEIRSWKQVFVCMAVYDIIVEFADGRVQRLSDHGSQLIEILKRKVPDRELPWQAE